MKPNQGSETVGTKNADSFWSEFSTALSAMGEKRPTGKGWKTMDEWISASGFGRSATSNRLTQGIKAGLLEKFEGTAPQNGRLVRAVWYRRKGS